MLNILCSISYYFTLLADIKIRFHFSFIHAFIYSKTIVCYVLATSNDADNIMVMRMRMRMMMNTKQSLIKNIKKIVTLNCSAMKSISH